MRLTVVGIEEQLEYVNMEWIPIVLVTFKLLVFGIGMFLAIKWHYDKEKQNKKENDKTSEP